MTEKDKVLKALLHPRGLRLELNGQPVYYLNCSHVASIFKVTCPWNSNPLKESQGCICEYKIEQVSPILDQLFKERPALFHLIKTLP